MNNEILNINDFTITLPTSDGYEDFIGHNEATSVCFEEWSKEHTFYCHFTPMEIDEGLYGDTIFVCKHCGHTVDIYGIKIHV